MTTITRPEAARAPLDRRTGRWWALLLLGIGWFIVGVVVLDFDIDSAMTIGWLVAGFLIAAGMTEFAMVGATESWRWVHALLGVLFIGGGILAFLEPLQTFGILAALFGFLLVVKGTVDFVTAIASRQQVNLWWLMLIAGVLEVALGFWASGYPGRSAALLILWVGLGALIRGVTLVVAAFHVRKLHEAVAA